MKSLLPALALISFTTLAHADDNCARKAHAYVKAVATVNYGTEMADEIEYTVDESKTDGKTQSVTMTAFGTGGEDSDTYDQYEVVLTKIADRCFSLVSMTLVGEN